MAFKFLSGEQPIIKVLHEHGVSSRDKRMSYIPCLQLPLTVRAGHVTINILPDTVSINWFLHAKTVKNWQFILKYFSPGSPVNKLYVRSSGPAIVSKNFKFISYN